MSRGVPTKLKQMMGGLLNASQESKILADKETGPKIKNGLYNIIPKEKWFRATKPVRGDKDDREFTYTTNNKDNAIPIELLAILKETMMDFDKDEIDAFNIRYYMGFISTETVIPPPSARVLSR